MLVKRPRDSRECENTRYTPEKKRKFKNDEYFCSLELATQKGNFAKLCNVNPIFVLHVADDNILAMIKDLFQHSIYKTEKAEAVHIL